jgi:CRISPR-associated exonuclease Cas4
MMHAGMTPPAEYEKRKCEGCSLMEVCQPQLGKRGMKAADWFTHALQNDS